MEGPGSATNFMKWSLLRATISFSFLKDFIKSNSKRWFILRKNNIHKKDDGQ